MNRIIKSLSISIILIAASGSLSCASETKDPPDNVYFTLGVHNDFLCDKMDCTPERGKTDPSDPLYPEKWISEWTMYTVSKNYQDNPPPYTNPPSTLSPDDYRVSYGATYYDSTYVPADGDGVGAMMEHYEEYCLPIFPIDNHYTCSFISLGNKAYFLTYKQNRPEDMPPCCLFSPQNHPPRRDFIKHLPYSPERSEHLNGAIQAYATELDSPSGPVLFGYAFYKDATFDSVTGEKYRHPQSFYFSGSVPVVNAPIVSQNYTSFRAQAPDPAKTWDLVAEMCPAEPVDCQLFDPPSTQGAAQPKSSGWDAIEAPGG